MSESAFDVIIVGAGSGGANLASQLADAGRRVAVVADGYVGGECAFVACLPSKSLLRSARARREAAQAVVHGGAGEPLTLDGDDVAWAGAVRRRDAAANHQDDSAEKKELEEHGVIVIRGHGRLDGPGRVVVDGDLLTAPEIVLDTGSLPVVPPIDGLDGVPHWTSDEALTSPERPHRLLILGGGPIGCELAQAYAAFGTDVTVIDVADRPVSGEDPELGEAMATVLDAAGVHLELGAKAVRATVEGDDVVLATEDGRRLLGDRVLVVVGRRPNTDDLGLDTVDVSPIEAGAIETDAHCHVRDGLWAIGDVTGLAPYTHTANHQAQIVLNALAGDGTCVVDADALPRAVFTEPPLAATGLTERQARERGLAVVVAQVDLADTSRAGAEGEGPLGPPDADGGLLRLIADADRRVLIGAGAIGRDADSWIAEATLAIRAEVPLSTLAQVVRAFPTYAEAFTLGYRDLLDRLDR